MPFRFLSALNADPFRSALRLIPAALLASALFVGCDLFGTAQDERAPRVEIVQPSGEATVSGAFVQLVIRAEALGESNYVSFVNITVNGEKAGEAEPSEGDFVFRWNSTEYPDATYRVDAVGFDRHQSRGISAPVMLTVQNESDGEGPATQIIAPGHDETVVGRTRIVVRTAPGPVAVSRVDLLVDGIPVSTETEMTGSDTYIFDWDTSVRKPGLHILEAKAYSGALSFRLSDPVSIFVEAVDESKQQGPPGSVQWRTAGITGEVKGSVAVGFNNDIYVASSSDTLYAFSQDGTPRWTFATQGPIRSAPVVGNNEDVFVTSEDGRLYGLDSDGHPLWPAYATSASLRSAPALGTDGVLYFGESAGRLHAVSSFDGQSLAGNWPVSVSASAILAPPVIARDRTVYVASTDGHLYAVSPEGVLLWKSAQDLGSVSIGMALVEQSLTMTVAPGETENVLMHLIYIVSNDGMVYAMDAEDGTVFWEYPVMGPLRSSPIVGTDGAIYVGTSTGLVALNPEMDDQTPRLRFIFPADDVGTPAVDANETIHFVSRNQVHAINPNNTPYWSFNLGSEADGPPAIRRDGALLVVGRNGLLTAFETGSVGLARSNWPMFQRNARHTGRMGIDAGD